MLYTIVAFNYRPEVGTIVWQNKFTIPPGETVSTWPCVTVVDVTLEQLKQIKYNRRSKSIVSVSKYNGYPKFYMED